jgi:TetR/AcrR family transcriptional regulator, cholesterol catabolism regulator
MVYLCTMFTEQQEKWLQRIEDMFMRFGIKSITMDDVARELGISKKTLYLFVENKDDLVNKVLERHILEEKVACEQILGKAGNAIEEMILVIESNVQQVSQMKSNIVHDLQRYHRDAWEKISAFQKGFLYTTVKNNLERGIREGLYRPNLDTDIITRLHIAQVFQLFDDELFPHSTYKKEVIFREYLLHYTFGIVSEKGFALLKAKLS